MKGKLFRNAVPIAPTSLLAIVAAGALLGSSSAQTRTQGIRFQDFTVRSGIDYTGMSFGLACGDFDGDGHPDVFLSRHHQYFGASLYRNRGDGTFVDTSNQTFDDPQAARTGDRHTPHFVDLDGDGRRELLVLHGADFGTSDGPNRFYELRNGKLVNVAAARGLAVPPARARTAAFLDIDLDGDLDQVLAAQRRADGQIGTSVLLQDATGTFGASTTPLLPDITAIGAQVLAVPGHGQLALLNSFSPRLFDVSGSAVNELTTPLGLRRDGAQRDTAVADFDNDGDLDILSIRATDGSDYTTEDRNTLRFSLRVNGNADELLLLPRGAAGDMRVRLFGFLTPAEVFLGPNRSNPSNLDFQLSSADPNHRGAPTYQRGVDNGVFVWYDPIPQAWRLVVTSPAFRNVEGILDTTVDLTDVGQLGFNPTDASVEPRLWTWDEDQFTETADEAGIARTMQGVAVAAGDFDNDGDIDIYAVQSTTVENLPNVVFENVGNGRFVPHWDGAGAAGTREGRGDAVAVVDLDSDGLLDLITTNGAGNPPFGHGPDQVFRGVGGLAADGSPNHWLLVDLVGTASNPDAVGAWVDVRAGNLKLTRFCSGGSHTYAQDDRRLHFGLGQNAVIDELVVRWPSGRVLRRQGVRTDQVLRLVEP